ncbi:MAG TPA: bifunctional acetate--CoA ligase family protein/GNAT family N-acetyltransferase [archaeon]|nr:bifunctional acetate--CoA ligase family protein/GNAT family N-acetyltransferase [archaeon]
MVSIEKMLNPKVVAVVGASESEGTVGQSLMRNLMEGHDARKIYPVNPNREAVMGLKSFPALSKIPEHIDLAVIATPAKGVPGLIEECTQAGVDGAVIISAGFREVGPAGEKLESEINEIRSKADIRILGPNCVGLARPQVNLNATFLRDNPQPGQIAFVSQSGALGAAILDWAVSTGIGFSMFASLGSTLDIDFGDLIDYLGDDPHTRSIILYMEGVGNAKKFMSAARGFARTKPIIVIKAGRHAAGAKAASSHTGALAGDFAVYEAAFKRAGVVMVDEIGDLFNCASVLDSRFLPAGPNLGIVTNAGGPAVLAADAVVTHGCQLAELSPETMTVMGKALPPFWSHGNPLDILGDANVSRYELAVKTCIADKKVDGLLVIYTPQGTTDPSQLAEAITKIAADRRKPMLTVWMGESAVRDSREIFQRNNIPTYQTPEEAVKTYAYMYQYRRNLDQLYQTPQELPVDSSPPKAHLKVVIRNAARTRKALTQSEVDRFLDAYDIPRVKGALAKSAEQAATIAIDLGYPVALKISSQDILHKTDVGGVVMGLDSAQAVKDAYKMIIDRAHKANPDARVDGIYVQKMVSDIDYELILGAKKDKDFGSVILFGMGGIGVELLNDVSIGLAPLNQILARRVMEETKIYRALTKGLRNKKPVDLRPLEEVMVRFSNLIVDFPEIAEMDINPLVASNGKFLVLDARVIIDPNVINHQPYPHLVITPYPAKYIVPWKLKDGTEVTLRPVKPEDEPLELEFIRGLSTETSRFRFFQIIKDLPHDALVRFCNIDYDREMAIIAEKREGERVVEIGVSRLIIDPGKRRGEFAVVVADSYQSRGLGTKLVDMLIEFAREKGIETIYGTVMSENIKMIQLCEKLGFTTRREHENVMAELKLS